MSYIDTRELIEERDNLAEEELTEESAKRIQAINDLLDEVGDEASYGVTLIPESEFEDYAQELAEDIGAIPRDYSWPASHIDWKAAADALRVDYSSVEFDGTDYLFRA